jgi:hypothetical protein
MSKEDSTICHRRFRNKNGVTYRKGEAAGMLTPASLQNPTRFAPVWLTMDSH